jgi:hypothetical protein
VTTDLEIWEADAARTDVPGQDGATRMTMGAMGLLEEANELYQRARGADCLSAIGCSTCVLDEAGDALWYASALARGAGSSLARAVHAGDTQAYGKDTPAAHAHRVLHFAWDAHRLVKRQVFQGHLVDRAALLACCVGVWASVCALAHAVGRRPGEALCLNTRKRLLRYPEGYEPRASEQRPRWACPACGA